MTGDFNNIEDAMDRLPMSEPPDASVIDLDSLERTEGTQRYEANPKKVAEIARLHP